MKVLTGSSTGALAALTSTIFLLASTTTAYPSTNPYASLSKRQDARTSPEQPPEVKIPLPKFDFDANSDNCINDPTRAPSAEDFKALKHAASQQLHRTPLVAHGKECQVVLTEGRARFSLCVPRLSENFETHEGVALRQKGYDPLDLLNAMSGIEAMCGEQQGSNIIGGTMGISHGKGDPNVVMVDVVDRPPA